MLKGVMLKIAIIHASDFGGGAERSVVSLHRNLQRLNHKSQLYVGYQLTSEPSTIQIPYVRGVWGGRRLARSLETHYGWQDIYNPSFRNLVNLIDLDTDVVHFNSLWGSGGFADLGALPSITRKWPGIITLRENWLLTGHCACFFECNRWRIGCGNCPDLSLQPAIPVDGTRFNWQRKQRIIKNSNVNIVVISDWLKRQAEASPILNNKPIHRIYNGIDLKVFKPVTSAEKTSLRHQLQIPNSKFAILLAGQTVEGINQGIATRYAVDALNQLSSDLVFPVVLGRSANRVLNMIHHPGIAIPFQNEPQNMAQYFQACDLTLVTSEVEAFGRIAAESQACGTPVVSFDSGGLPEVVLDKIGGRIVPSGDVKGLIRAIDYFYSNPSVRDQCSIKGIAHVRANFDELDIANQYANLYQQIKNGESG